MTDESKNGSAGDEQVPFLQKLYDRPFILLAAGIIVMVLFYTGWGFYEILSLPEATLP